MHYPPRHGTHYALGEIALVYLCDENDENRAKLAEILDRTPQAVQWIWDLCKRRELSESAENRVGKQVEEVSQLLGAAKRGRIKRLTLDVDLANAELNPFVDVAKCPAESCPLRDELETNRREDHEEDRGEDGGAPKVPEEREEEFLWHLTIAGGRGRKSSVAAFMDLVIKNRTRSKGDVRAVYITDRFVFADAGERQTEGGYSTLIEYLGSLGLTKTSTFSLYMTGSPEKSALQRERGDDIGTARQILERLVRDNFPNAQICGLPQRHRFHDRLYLFVDSGGDMNGVFGPSLNGLRDDDIALMGEIEDVGVLKSLARMLA